MKTTVMMNNECGKPLSIDEIKYNQGIYIPSNHNFKYIIVQGDFLPILYVTIDDTIGVCHFSSSDGWHLMTYYRAKGLLNITFEG